MKTNTTSLNVNFIRVISIFAVVLLHISAAFVIEIKDTTSYEWIIGNLFDSFVRWCVPVFIMLSGYLLLRKDTLNEDSILFYKKRVLRLGIPILIWSCFFLIWGFLKTKLKGEIEPSLFINVIKPLINGEPHYHLWFLFMIICLYAVTPLIRKVMLILTEKELWIYSFIFLGLSSLEIFFQNVSIKPFFLNFMQYIPFFILGYLIGKIQFSKKYFFYSIIIFLIASLSTFIGTFYIVNNLEYNKYILYDYLSLTTILSSTSIFYILLNITINEQVKKISLLAPLTLGIYIIHPLFIESARYLSLKVENYNPILSIPLFTFIIFILSSFLIFILLKIPYIRRIVS